MLDTSDTSDMKNLDFDNGTNENTFSHNYISYIANERLHGENSFILRTNF